MSNSDFYDLMSIDSLQWGRDIDPIGLLTYQTHKRKKQFYTESADNVIHETPSFWNTLEKNLEPGDISILKKISSNGNKISGNAKSAIAKILDKAIKIDRQKNVDSDPLSGDISTTLAVKSFIYSLKEEVQLTEVLNLQQRMRRKLIMRRLAPRLARARKIAMRRHAGNDVLKRRAVSLARKTMARKLLGGRNKADVSPGERARVEKILAKRKLGIQRLATRLVPVVRKKQALRFANKSNVAKKATPSVVKTAMKPSRPTAPTSASSSIKPVSPSTTSNK